jgi:pyruvate dehydrogenase phosphatase
VYTRKIFGNVEGGMRSLGPVLERIKTPPYVSARADVEHHPLARLRPHGEAILILASDGLQALSDPEGGQPPVLEWMKSVVRGASRHEDMAGWNKNDHRASTILRDALGGKDDMRVSAMLNVEMMGKWCDDTTVIVQRIFGW